MPFGLMFMLVGVIVGAYGFWMYRRDKLRAATASHWPSVEGRVASSEVVTWKDRTRGMQRDQTYEPRVTYTYEAVGLQRQGQTIRFDTLLSSSRTAAEKIVARYPAGAAVSVRFDPEHPEQAVLETTPPGPASLFIGGTGAAFAALGLFFQISGA